MIRNKLIKGGRDFDTTRNMRYTCSIFEATYLKVLLVIALQMCTCSQRYEEVDYCPMNQTEWSRRAAAKNCPSVDPNYRYLCASIQDNPCHFGEICTKDSYITKGECAVINGHTHNMDSTYCHAASGCPDEKYEFSNLYLYQTCFQDFYSETTGPCPSTQSTTTRSTVRADTDGSLDVVIVIVIGVLVILLIVIVILYRRKKLLDWMRNSVQSCIGGETCNRSNRETEDEGNEMVVLILGPVAEKQKIRKLHRYFVHILKEELKVADLQENIILCSLSLKEHFSENLMKDLYNVKTEDDYDNLDMTVVFALLINFCTKIKPPLKGWGYEPSKDDISVGADVERIRSMWNEYCDNEHQYPQLQGVYSRMIERYGEIPERTSNEDERFEGVRTKYQVLMLKKNCTVKNGVVLTESLKSALQLLETSDIVICRGAIGCGKSTAMRYIQEQFKDKQWKTVWMEEYVNDTDLSEYDIENTLLCCDNLFGTFSCNAFPSDLEKLGMVSSNVFSSKVPSAVQCTIEKKRKIYGERLKIVLGIHNHVYDMVIKEYALELFQNKKWIIDMDKHTQAELLLIWKEEKKKGHCAYNPNCWFKKLNFSFVSAKLSPSRGLIGNPLLLSMYCLHHNFFSDDEFTKSPVSTLVDYYKAMQKDNSELFYALVFITFVTIYNKERDIEDWAQLGILSLTTDTFRSIVEKYSIYFNEDEKTIELKHELLNIALYKVATEIREVRDLLVDWCGLNIILQLTRSGEILDNEFICQLSDDNAKMKLSKRIEDASQEYQQKTGLTVFQFLKYNIGI